VAKKKDKNRARDSGGRYNQDYWLSQDPRELATMRGPAEFQRLRDLVDKEILHQAWGCKLWTLERLGKITRDQRMAGDQYGLLVEHRDRDLNAKVAYRDAAGLLRHGNLAIHRAVDELVLEELMPVTETDLKRCRDGLERLVYFFGIRKNKPRTTP
jgi:hypothetical protein